MIPVRKEQLTHILWIGGGPDAGKSSVARKLAERHNLSAFHYDREDAGQVERLAQTVPEFRMYLQSSMEERWVHATPEAMFDFVLVAFCHRFPLVLERLLQQPAGRSIIVEGFGLLPELVQPVLTSPFQAIWFVPTEQFKRESMARRGKPSFASTLSDPEKAKENVMARDRLLADYYRQQVPAFGLTLLEIDGTRSIEEVTDVAEAHFSRYRPSL